MNRNSGDQDSQNGPPRRDDRPGRHEPGETPEGPDTYRSGPQREQEQDSGGSNAAVWILGICGVVFLLGIVSLVGGAYFFGSQFSGMISEITSMTQATQEVQSTSVSRAEQEVNSSITLKDLIDNPEEVEGEWVQVSGRVVSMGSLSEEGGEMPESSFGGGEPSFLTTKEFAGDPRLTMQQTVMVMDQSGSTGLGYEHGTDVEVLGRVVVMDLSEMMRNVLPESEFEDMQERGASRTVMLLSKRVEEVESKDESSGGGEETE